MVKFFLNGRENDAEQIIKDLLIDHFIMLFRNNTSYSYVALLFICNSNILELEYDDI